jgi:hypothetical protein
VQILNFSPNEGFSIKFQKNGKSLTNQNKNKEKEETKNAFYGLALL